MNDQRSGREHTDQTYPAASTFQRAPVPPTENQASKRANTPETTETYADDLTHRVEDRPEMEHRTGGRDVERSASIRPDVEAPRADGNEPVPAREQEEPAVELPRVGGASSAESSGEERDPSIRNEKQA
ncbi:MAG: hypothetical protein ACRENC_17740, partial [Gemmatimonadaceae bacterium]